MARQAGKAGKERVTGKASGEARGKGGERAAVVPRAATTPGPSTGPFHFMHRFADEMERLLGELRTGASGMIPRLEFPWEEGEGGEAAWSPAVEVAERGGKLVVRAELPGLGKDDIKVDVRQDSLSIQGERRHEREEKRRGFYRSERSYGSFYRQIPLPEGIDPEQATATFRNGVLEITMPAPPKPAKGRRVPIEQP